MAADNNNPAVLSDAELPRALNKTIHTFLNAPGDLEVQQQLAEQLASFQQITLRLERERLAKKGTKKSMTGADERAPALHKAWSSLKVNDRAFMPIHYDILEVVQLELLHKATGEKNGPSTQQASAVQAFVAHVSSVTLRRRAYLNFALGAGFLALTLGSLFMGFALILPLVAASFHLGILLAPPLAMGLATAMLVIVPICMLITAVAFRAAQQCKPFFPTLRETWGSLVQAFRALMATPAPSAAQEDFHVTVKEVPPPQRFAVDSEINAAPSASVPHSDHKPSEEALESKAEPESAQKGLHH
ncbi:MAG TPA: hypothetical protein VD770_03355 [Coxiellaceae bacterium]|nr:hypothetical protein [Coxiellaceae bacterium]